MGNYRQKILVERAMKRLDERTPLDARRANRLEQNPTTKAPAMMQQKASVAVNAVEHEAIAARMNIVKKALEDYDWDYIIKGDNNSIVVSNLLYGTGADDGFINDEDITKTFREELDRKIEAVNDRLHNKDYYINTNFTVCTEIDPMGSKIFGDLTVTFIPRKTGIDTTTKEGQLEGLKVYNQIESELKSHIEALLNMVQKFTDQWDNSYRRTWAKNESIAYADLPWTEKTHPTVNVRTYHSKLFGNKNRLNEAIDRMFEDAVEIGANFKTE